MSYKSGQWLAVCDRCGFEFLAKDLKKDWQGLMVCSNDYELRNPQDFIRVRPEKITPPWTRPEPEDEFITAACDLWTTQGRADFGTADCARADQATPIEILIELFRATAIAECAIAGRSLPGVELYCD